MKLLVFGKTGQVGRELSRYPGVVALNRSLADLSRPDDCVKAVEANAADVIINAAAYTAVDQAEQEESRANVINGESPGAIAHAAAKMDIPFLHISTDYVFDGRGTDPFTPDAACNPLGAYGRSKLKGEIGVRSANGKHAILRTSWVFSAHGSNFVKTMLRLGAERDSLDIVADQTGGPTAAADIAKALMRIAQSFHGGKDHTGTYHFAGSPDVNWADFARAIFRQANLATIVNDIPSSSYPTPAERPENSRLDCSSLATSFGIQRPDWRHSLDDVIRQSKAN